MVFTKTEKLSDLSDWWATLAKQKCEQQTAQLLTTNTVLDNINISNNFILIITSFKNVYKNQDE